jgi:regulator of cell morphogenesis and NO signaling
MILLYKDMKMADLILSNYKLLQVLSRFGIKLGFGEKSIAEVCRLFDVSPELFLLVCNVYSVEDFLPGKEELSEIPLSQLISYLKKSHDYYLKERIPHIEEHLDCVAEKWDGRKGKILKQFFLEYKEEVANHLKYEEDVVFPYVNRVNNNERSEYTITQFEENHSNIEDKLNDLKNIIIKYLPDTATSCRQNDILVDLFLMQEDLNKHTLIENKILIPFVQELEHSRK